jgi:urease accessory protein
MQRTGGDGRIVFKAVAGATALDRLYQGGAAKIRLPHSHGRRAMEAVLINTSGGLAGGDRLDWRVEAADQTQAVITTQSCERAYRSLGDPTRVSVSLRVGAGARLDWLPQETILYDGSSLLRRLDADVAPGGTLLVSEAVLLGRLAYGERVRMARFHDRWRIRRGGRLVFAEETRFDGPVDAIAARAATLGGGAAYASILLLTDDPGAALHPVRAALASAAGEADGGASAFDGKLICRVVAQDGLRLRRALIPVLTVFRGGLGLPRVWAN